MVESRRGKALNNKKPKTHGATNTKPIKSLRFLPWNILCFMQYSNINGLNNGPLFMVQWSYHYSMAQKLYCQIKSMTFRNLCFNKIKHDKTNFHWRNPKAIQAILTC